MVRNLLCATSLAIASTISIPLSAQADDHLDVTGVWFGSYDVAFPEGHGHFPGEVMGAQMELHIERQEGNLFWARNRWRLDEQGDWHVEGATGTFDLYDPTIMSIVEISPNPDYGSTGYFTGKMADEKLYLTYRGIGRGISFNAVLTRK